MKDAYWVVILTLEDVEKNFFSFMQSTNSGFFFYLPNCRGFVTLQGFLHAISSSWKAVQSFCQHLTISCCRVQIADWILNDRVVHKIPHEILIFFSENQSVDILVYFYSNGGKLMIVKLSSYLLALSELCPEKYNTSMRLW